MKGHIRSLGPDKFRIFVHVGDGKYASELFRGTLRGAQRRASALVAKQSEGELIAPSNITVADLLERWLNDHASRVVATKSLERYREIAQCHLIPALGQKRLSKLTALDVEAYYTTALISGRRDPRKQMRGLSPRTVLHHHRVLSAALKRAVRWKLVTRNVCDDVTPPRPVDTEMKALSSTDLLQLTEWLKTRAPRLYAPVVAAATTGLRRGELLAIRWSDFDLTADNPTLSVTRSLEETKAGLNFKAPKTKKSRRNIGLLSLTIDVLRKHRADQAKARLAAGPLWHDNDLVFPDYDGRPWRPGKLTDVFIDAMRALPAELKYLRLRFHDLRHSHATMLLTANIHPKIVSERLGHSKVGITLDTYSHVLEGMDAEAVRTLDTMLRSEAVSG